MNDKKPILYDQYNRAIPNQDADNDPHPKTPGPATAHETAPNDNNQQTRGPRKFQMERAAFFISLVTAAAVVATAIIYFGQLKEMIKATNATGKAIEVSAGQMSIMQRQLADSEAQQRAMLKIEKFSFRKSTNQPNMTISPDCFTLEQDILIKNYGSTPAMDLSGEGQFIQSGLEEMDKRLGIKSYQHRWSGGERTPRPTRGAGIILPQETLTNSGLITSQIVGDSLYIEMWFSYRDIFGRAYVIGEAGNYTLSNDTFFPVMIYPVHLQTAQETNQETKPK
jgi:hypothetical protein